MKRTNLFRLAVVTVLTMFFGPAAAAQQEFEGLRVEVVGEGRPVLMIPGLNSAAETWRETCAALQADRIQCHLVQLPGFAGLPATPNLRDDAWLADMRDRVVSYIEVRKLRRPVVVGHSLGGVLALQIAIARPDAVDRLVVVDSLPFLPAATNPAATPETTRAMAEGVRKQMLTQQADAYRAGAAAAVKNMASSPERVQTLERWGEASDRTTTAQAMYELMTIDLRPQLQAVRAPTLVLGSWAGYAQYGATRESTEAIFEREYATLPGVRIELSDAGRHFLMWDDPEWLVANVRQFIQAPAPRGSWGAASLRPGGAAPLRAVWPAP